MDGHIQPAFDESGVAKPEILDACCGGRMWWWQKEHPLTVADRVRR